MGLLMIDWNNFVNWAFFALITIVAIRASKQLDQAVDTAEKLKDSIQELNTNVAIIVQRTDNHEKRLEKLEDKV